MIELKPGSHYFLVIQHGSYNGPDLDKLEATWKEVGIHVHVLRVWEMPSHCMAFTEKEKVA